MKEILLIAGVVQLVVVVLIVLKLPESAGTPLNDAIVTQLIHASEATTIYSQRGVTIRGLEHAMNKV